MRNATVRIQGDGFTDRQLAVVARLHREHVGHGFLSSLGEPFLRLLYRHISVSRHCGLFIAHDPAGRPIGYICGTRNTSALYRELIRDCWRPALRLLVPKLLAPGRLLRAVETLRYPRRDHAGLPAAEIINFVVVPPARGHGVAPELFRCLVRWFEDQGCTEVKIVTGERQGRAHGFYEKVGARMHGPTSIHRGSLSRVYVYRPAEQTVGPTPSPAADATH